MTIKEHCNFEDLYTQYVKDYRIHCENEPINKLECDFNELDDWYTEYRVLKAKINALEELAERFGYRFLATENGYALALWGD